MNNPRRLRILLSLTFVVVGCTGSEVVTSSLPAQTTSTASPTASTTTPSATTAPSVTAETAEIIPWGAPTSSEISIARAFFDARNAYDVESAAALFAPDAHVHEGSFITGVDMYRALFDWLRATGWQWVVDECHMKAGDANTSCAYHVENAWSRATGRAPVQGGIAFEIWDVDGLMMRWVPDFKVNQTDFLGGDQDAPNEQLVEVWETVTDWIRANHPTDLGAMISLGGSAPILNARSIDLWRLYTQEFVEAVE